MKEVLNKLKKGTIIEFGDNKAVVVSNLMKFKKFYFIYADIIENADNNIPCCTYKIDDKIALIIRDKEKLLQMGLTAEKRKAIYCHELGHCFSINQKNKIQKGRDVFEEVDSDTFAVKQCGISPYVLERALAKSYEYEIKNISRKKSLTQERVDRYIQEMKARKRNVEKLIQEYERGR